MVSQRQSYLRLLTAKNRCCVFFIRITFNTSSIATAQTKHEEFSEVWLGRLGGPRSSQRPFFEVFCITLGDQIARLHTGDGGWHPNRVNLSTIDSCRQGTYGRASERARIQRARERVDNFSPALSYFAAGTRGRVFRWHAPRARGILRIRQAV